MKKWLIVLMCSLIVGCATVPTARMSVKPNRDFSYIKRVAVFPFDPEGIITDRFTTELIAISKFDVVERGQLGKVIEEQKLSLSGLLDDKTRKELGNLLGVDALFLGSAETTSTPYYVGGTELTVAKAGVYYHTTMSIRLVDIETGDILISCSAYDPGRQGCIMQIIRQLQTINSIFFTPHEISEIRKREIINAYLAGDKKKAKKLKKKWNIKVRRSDIERARKQRENEKDRLKFDLFESPRVSKYG